MSANDNQLLRRYLRERSESAFAELVGRHLPLVFSAALRQVNGDAQAAEDVAQSVFIDLARKAPSLLEHTSLTGWLYTSTRYLAANARRAASRRLAHENAAQIMNELSHSEMPEPDWARLRPALDEAMHDLADADREAVLWRYFEKHPFSEIGARLGLNENAARMRVERALEKLRGALAKRGVTSSAAALALLVANQAIGAVPVGLASQVCRASVLAVGTGGVAGLLVGLSASSKTKLALGLVAVSAILGLMEATRRTTVSAPPDRSVVTASGESSNDAIAEKAGPIHPIVAGSNITVPSVLSANDRPQLQLKLVAADSGDPIPNAEVQCDRDDGSDSSWGTVHSDSSGTADISLPGKLASLELYVRVDGFAGMIVGWRPPRGEAIPTQYVLRLERAVTLGGWVVDANGAPVVGAMVEGGKRAELLRESQRETPLGSFKATTDASGKWRSRQVAPEMVRELQLDARHPEHGSSDTVAVQSSSEIEGLLRAESYTLRLRSADSVSGEILDPDQKPVGGATVLLGELYTTDMKRTKSAADGTFEFAGVPRGKRVVTGSADGFANTTVQIDAQPDSRPIQLVLSRGKPLTVRVVDLTGQPIAGADVWVNPSHPDNRFIGIQWGAQPPTNEVVPQFALSKNSDADGRVVFAHVPDAEVEVGAGAGGHMQECGHRVRPGGGELVLSLGPELVVSGTVKDANGGLIPRFKMTVGEKTAQGFRWSAIDRFQMSFEGGVFRQALKEATDCTGTNSGYWLKFEAEGFSPFVSRFIAPDEPQVQLDVTLQSATLRQLTVLNPDGTPAGDADVGLLDVAVVSGNSISIVPGGLGRRHSRTDDALHRADAGGHVQFAEEGIHHIVAASAAGYVEVDLDKLSDGFIRLQPWGRVEGTLPAVEGQSSEHEVLFQFQGIRGANGLMADFFSGFRLRPDKDGKFSFPLVPPGHHRIVELIPDGFGPEAQAHTFGNGRSAEMEVRPGETTSVDLVESAKVN